MAPLGWALYGLVSVAGPLGWLVAPFTGMPSAVSTEAAWVSLWASGWGSALVGFAGWKLGFASPRRWIIWMGMLGFAVFCGVAYGFLCMAMSA
ncbi:hypothetical protein WDL1CHR_03399 [Variovorax sp. WDL1]|nr:hypothetical protein APY03_2364 [Variovorax sp. WDL1]PNG58845.1 hypothetical protein CHC07_00570 [Variovorax sp. B4]PNG61365.1 hypothetical protein CHC06_01266 [Variovorax sp. B2]VTV12636.1 hypothetical protein WDL1CHR_03399 [Variovorax sp. WDL1]